MTTESQAPTREATLTLLLRQGENSAANLAASLGISVQAMRRHLRSLEDDGLVEASPTPTGPGRPSNLWQLTEQGHHHFPDGSENFALGLMESMKAALSPETFTSLLVNKHSKKPTSTAISSAQGQSRIALRSWWNYVAKRAMKRNGSPPQMVLAGSLKTFTVPCKELQRSIHRFASRNYC